MSDRPRVRISIRELRKATGLTQEALSAELGISRQALIALEQGLNSPSLPLTFRIAHFFNLSVDDMFGNVRSATPADTKKGVLMTKELVPFSPLREMRETIDRMMDDSMLGFTNPRPAVPALNVHQDDQAITVELHAPSYRDDDIEIEIGDGFITISGQTAEQAEDQSRQYLHREWQRQNFCRTITLPDSVNAEQAKAELKDGVLTIVLPKMEPEKPKVTKLKVGNK